MKILLFFGILLFSILTFSQSEVNDSCVFNVPQFLSFPDCGGSNALLISYNCIPDTFEFKLFNRFGNLVFKTKNIDVQWQGEAIIVDSPEDKKINKKMIPEGTYYFILDASFIEKRNVLKTGYLRIKR